MKILETGIGEQIKLAMNEKGVTNERLAKALQVSTQRVYDITKCKDIKMSTLMRISDALGIKPSELLGE